jgi:hypothetical protein
MQSSHYLDNSLHQQQTTDRSQQTVNTWTRTSFRQHVDQILVPNMETGSSIFLNTNQFSKSHFYKNETFLIYLDSQQLIEYIDANIIGRNLQIRTPWGIRPGKLTYFSDIFEKRSYFFCSS